MQLSKHLSIAEFEYSSTAVARKISNKMDSIHIVKAKDLAENVFEPIREHLGKPIKVNSGFRGERLNKAIGGASSSQHCKGEAIDLDLHDRELFEWIIDNIEFDQLIYEGGDDNEADWFHISYRKNHNRKQVLRMVKKNGKSTYLPYKRK